MKPGGNDIAGAGGLPGHPAFPLSYLQTHCSTLIERALEYQFLGLLTSQLLCRGMTWEVLRSDIDTHGYDVLVEANGIPRHIQLKGTVLGGKRRDVDVHADLASKPAGSVLWMHYDPADFAIMQWRWFGAPPGQHLPDIGDKPVRHTRGGEGGKALRPRLKRVSSSRFRKVSGIAELADLLFGRAVI